MTHKMFFNTGVKPENRLNSKGELILMPFQFFQNGTMKIEYYLESEPKATYKLKYLAGKEYLNYIKLGEIAIKIVDGGMLSDYAIFFDTAMIV